MMTIIQFFKDNSIVLTLLSVVLTILNVIFYARNKMLENENKCLYEIISSQDLLLAKLREELEDKEDVILASERLNESNSTHVNQDEIEAELKDKAKKK